MAVCKANNIRRNGGEDGRTPAKRSLDQVDYFSDRK